MNAFKRPGKFLRKILVDDSAVSAIIGDSIYPWKAPGDLSSRIYATYLLDSYEEDPTHEGASSLGDATIELNLFVEVEDGTDPDSEMESLFNAVYNALSGYKGSVTINSDTLYIDGIWLNRVSETLLQATASEDQYIYNVTVLWDMDCQSNLS